MSIHKLEIPREKGESLFLGPDSLGVMPCKGVNPGKIVLRPALSSSAELFTARSVIKAFPEEAVDNVPSQDMVDMVFRSLYPQLPNLSRDDVSLAFEMFNHVSDCAEPLPRPPLRRTLDFKLLYFLRDKGKRAMMNVVFDEESRTSRFSVWADSDTVVTTHERLVAVLSGVVEDETAPDDERARAREAVRCVWRARDRRNLPGIVGDMKRLGVEDLVKKYGKFFQSVLGRS